MPDRRVQVFISTTRELDAEVKELCQGINDKLYDIVYFEAEHYRRGESPLRWMRRRIMNANAFIGLLGVDYGSLYPPTRFDRLWRRTRCVYALGRRRLGGAGVQADHAARRWEARRDFIAKNRKRSWCVWEYELALKRRKKVYIGFYEKDDPNRKPEPLQARFIRRVSNSRAGHQYAKFPNPSPLPVLVEDRLDNWAAQRWVESDIQDKLVFKWFKWALPLVMLVLSSVYCVRAGTLVGQGEQIMSTSFSVFLLVLAVLVVALLLIIWAFWSKDK